MTTSMLTDRVKATFAAATAASTFALSPAAAQTTPVNVPADAAATTQIKHPLLANERARIRYNVSLAQQLVKATGDNAADPAVAHFTKVLEARLAGPNLSRPQSLGSNYVGPDVYVISGVVPPAHMYHTAPIGICAEKAGQIVYTADIYPDGRVERTTPAAAPGTGPAGEFQYACRPTILAIGRGFMNTASPAPENAPPRGPGQAAAPSAAPAAR